MKWVLATFLFAGTVSSAAAMDVGSSDYVFSSALAADGYTPFAVSGTGSASFGMMRGADLYLCFIADSGTAQAERQRVLLAEIAGETPDRAVPNIPVVCILTQ